ncbi:hypothetical protein Glove_151g79 [Diversispora epigaea]|uniref:Uncharacterized protein n=1 Tax=Diversispora epigaea TaxID=1348612 RepID=A0A397J247_9GLOM|nr:hypothetical protein Glove_151g79 [Diversispora epigaea]
MSQLNHCIVITLSILFFLIVLGSFVTVDLQDIPEQDKSKHTGYPVWTPPIDGVNGRGNDEKSIAAGLFGCVMMSISGYYIIKWTRNNNNKRKITFFVLNDDKTVPTIEFDVILGVYCLVTTFVSLLYNWINLGKLWMAFGIFHNVLEFIILVNMHYGGRIISSVFLGILSLYVVISTGLSIFLPWPHDALWFKMQGLCLDWALVIQFTRTYFNTKKHIKNDFGVNPLIRDDDDNETGEGSDVVYNSKNDVIFHPPYQVLLLVAASGFHIFGNVISTIWIHDIRAFYTFLLTYALAYPAYAYFVYLDTQAITVLPRKVIHLPDTTRWKVVVVTIFSIALSFLSIRFALPSVG